VKIDATADEIRALLSLAERDQGTCQRPPDAARPATEPEAAQGRVPPFILERYHALIAAGRLPAIATIERGTCSGCHLRLPAMVESKAARTLALYPCPHCRRLLYTRELLHQDSGIGHAKPSRRTRRAVAESRST